MPLIIAHWPIYQQSNNDGIKNPDFIDFEHSMEGETKKIVFIETRVEEKVNITGERSLTISLPMSSAQNSEFR